MHAQNAWLRGELLGHHHDYGATPYLIRDRPEKLCLFPSQAEAACEDSFLGVKAGDTSHPELCLAGCISYSPLSAWGT